MGRSRSWVRRHPVLTCTLAGAAAVVGVVGMWKWWHGSWRIHTPTSAEEVLVVGPRPLTLVPEYFRATSTQEMVHENTTAIRRCPHFEAQAVIHDAITPIKSEEYAGKFLVLYFFASDFGCTDPSALSLWSERIDEFRDLGCEVLAISTDSVYAHLHWTRTLRSEGGIGSVEIPIVSDVTHKISKDFGIQTADEGDTSSLRTLVIVSPDNQGGRIRHVSVVSDQAVEQSVDEALRLIHALQHVEKHHEQCPVDWMPGEEAVVPDPQQSQEFFARRNPVVTELSSQEDTTTDSTHHFQVM